MRSIVFADVEVNPRTDAVLDIGALNHVDAVFRGRSIVQFTQFVQGAEFVCGHNMVNHDYRYLRYALDQCGLTQLDLIDTLFLSALLFPRRPYHALLKDEKLQTDELNNPVADSKKARELFYDEIGAFMRLDASMRQVLYGLLAEQPGFHGFFRYLGYAEVTADLEMRIRERLGDEICHNASLHRFIREHPVELAYALTIIDVRDRYSLTPAWVLRTYPATEMIMDTLRNRPCLLGCPYCDSKLDATRSLKRWFGFDAYRSFDGEPLQQRAVEAALANKSLLAVFPTGGGKSVTFQVPALVSGENVKGLTVVISPLQSLMKDQVDNLGKADIVDAVTINGLLDPLERASSMERVADGSASILYISPEALRSRTMARLLEGRKVVRFVVDEAHCFSAWGQDFRVDYMYIGDFIRQLQDKKGLLEPIPVSCFTATAKPKVIEDIRTYFKEKLGLDLELYTTGAARKNLRFQVMRRDNAEDKYESLRRLLLEANCPAIVYVSRTRTAYDLAQRLSEDGLSAKPYHGQMERTEKSANQDAFLAGQVDIMVATSAFGMGVDKKDVGLVVHFEISDSLENYVQEAGRAGRDENIEADCYVLFDEDDLDKHFAMLNRTKISIREIQQVWKAIKDVTRVRMTASQSALEIARRAGWDDVISDVETRVRTAIAALEDAGYLRRGQNMPRVYADSIQHKTASEAIAIIRSSESFSESEREDAIRIIQSMVTKRSISRALGADDDVEGRVDYIADNLGLSRERVIKAVALMREVSVLADAKDLSAYIRREEKVNKSLQILETFAALENFLVNALEEDEASYHLKELNEAAEQAGLKGISPARTRMVLNFWAIRKQIRYGNEEHSRNHVRVMPMIRQEKMRDLLELRHELAKFILDYLFRQISAERLEQPDPEILVGFSMLELKQAYESEMFLFKRDVKLDDLEDALFYLSRIEAIKVEGGFLVLYNPMQIERLEKNLRRSYKREDYRNLEEYYANRMQQIHIVGEYARMMLADYRMALQFVEDYFRLNYANFLAKYFPGSRGDEIKRNITPAKFKQLFGELSAAQLNIIKDNDSLTVVVLAGPGSGKTRVLVHKLASLLLMEDVKSEQLLMLTFSRAAATEFKERLIKLIQNAAYYVDIKTFHSYCFDLLGKVGNIDNSDEVVRKATEMIGAGEVEPNRITKTVLVIDEAQDIDEDSYNLIRVLREHNDNMRLIAVGDDDQNIYEFRGSSSRYMASLLKEDDTRKYELLGNYRSCRNLVDFTNGYAEVLRGRLKEHNVGAVSRETGSIRLTKYRSANLVTPFAADILNTELSGSVCALTRTNHEALQVTGILTNAGRPAKLIQSIDGFRLRDLVEIRDLVTWATADESSPRIEDDQWKAAVKNVRQKYARSTALDLCERVIRAYESVNRGRKYKSDLKAFVYESRLEDFYAEMGEKVLVSTMHKAKGKEFDNVFLLLDGMRLGSEEEKRQVYVAMTRAKRNLSVHLTGDFLDRIQVEGLTSRRDNGDYAAPSVLAMELSLKDVFLGSCMRCQPAIMGLQSGDELRLADNHWLTTPNGVRVIKFSRRFGEVYEKKLEQGYSYGSGKVAFVVWWYDEGSQSEYRVVLPEIYLVENRDSEA